MTLDPARAAIRRAVRHALPEPAGTPVLVACSGGADSLALLAATVFEVARAGAGRSRVIGVTVDHGLQDGSREHAARVVAQMAELGADETASIRITVDPGPMGVEAGAREARYAALSQLSAHFGAAAVLLGHTRDDQAETVLLGLTHGSGGRALQGMRRGFEQDGAVFLRPLLDVTRAETEAACRADAITWWEDPHNADPRFTRSRIRHTVLPLLERELGPGVAESLARTADLLREDTAYLDDQADALYAAAVAADGTIDVGTLAVEPAALTGRVLRRALIAHGAIPSELTREHVVAVRRVLGQKGKEIQLPGHLTAYSDGAVLRFRRTGSSG